MITTIKLKRKKKTNGVYPKSLNYGEPFYDKDSEVLLIGTANNEVPKIPVNSALTYIGAEATFSNNVFTIKLKQNLVDGWQDLEGANGFSVLVYNNSSTMYSNKHTISLVDKDNNVVFSNLKLKTLRGIDAPDGAFYGSTPFYLYIVHIESSYSVFINPAVSTWG